MALPAYSSFPRRKEKSHDHSLILEKVVGLEDNEEKEGQKNMLTCSAQTQQCGRWGLWTSRAVCPQPGRFHLNLIPCANGDLGQGFA